MDSKFYFNLKEAISYQAVQLAGLFGVIEFLKKIFLILFIIIFLLFFHGFIFEIFPVRINQVLLGSALISLVLFIACWLKCLFFNLKLKNPKVKVNIKKSLTSLPKYNLAEFLNFETARAVNKSIVFARAKKLSQVNSTILFYFLLQDNPNLNFIFSRALLSVVDIKNILKNYLEMQKKIPGHYPGIFKDTAPVYSKDFQDVIFEAFKTAEENKHQIIKIDDILIALAKHNLIFQEIINTSDIKVDDIKNLAEWLSFLEEKIKKRKEFWEWESLIRRGSLAKEWSTGFTITLDMFSIDLSEVAKKRNISEAIGHKKDIEEIERILSHKESNNDVLLIGEAGTGKKSIVQWLALKFVLGQSLPELNYKRIVALDIPAILTQSQNKNEAQFILNKIFQEVITAGNVILTINDFHNFVRKDDQPGIIDITGILSSYISSPQFQVIAITNYDGLHQYIEKKSAILEFFEKVEIKELSEKEILVVLQNFTLMYEQKYKKFITYLALKKIIFLANRYIPDVPFPKKAILLLEEVVTHADFAKERIILPEYISKIVSEKVKIPVGEIENKERDLLLNLEKLIHQKIINQQEAVKEISTALRRARVEMTARKGPMGTFLFLGPSGVGKTETAKALADIYFGSEAKMIRLDMSEFQSTTDIPRLIGSIEENGLLTIAIKKNPFSIILLDEIEKAHKNILNLFLQVLDEGHLTDGLGRKINFENTIIIATSNAGSQIIIEALREKIEWSTLKEKLLDYIFKQNIFRPEFINRFDGVVIFQPLSKENLLDITELMLQKIKKNLKEKNIKFIINEPLKEKIVELGYNPVFGARELKRVIQDKVENIIASAFLSNQLKRGNEVEVVVEQDEFKLKIQ